MSAVGHEIDFTLCDFAADVREAETPSAAAELIRPAILSPAPSALDQAAAALAASRGARQTTRAGERLDHARTRLRLLTPAAQVERGWLRLDDAANRLASALKAAVHAPRRRLAEARTRLDRASPELRLPLAAHRLLALRKRLEAASPASVLNRGFALVRDERGRPVSRRAALRPGQRLAAEFADGAAPMRVEPS